MSGSIKKWDVKFSQHNLSTGWTGCGHFTQLVWKGSKKLGLGVAQDRSGKRYVVAQYDPVGNLKGKYEVYGRKLRVMTKTRFMF